MQSLPGQPWRTNRVLTDQSIPINEFDLDRDPVAHPEVRMITEIMAIGYTVCFNLTMLLKVIYGCHQRKVPVVFSEIDILGTGSVPSGKPPLEDRVRVGNDKRIWNQFQKDRMGVISTPKRRTVNQRVWRSDSQGDMGVNNFCVSIVAKGEMENSVEIKSVDEK